MRRISIVGGGMDFSVTQNMVKYMNLTSKNMEIWWGINGDIVGYIATYIRFSHRLVGWLQGFERQMSGKQHQANPSLFPQRI